MESQREDSNEGHGKFIHEKQAVRRRHTDLVRERPCSPCHAEPDSGYDVHIRSIIHGDTGAETYIDLSGRMRILLERIATLRQRGDHPRGALVYSEPKAQRDEGAPTLRARTCDGCGDIRVMQSRSEYRGPHVRRRECTRSCNPHGPSRRRRERGHRTLRHEDIGQIGL